MVVKVISACQHSWEADRSVSCMPAPCLALRIIIAVSSQKNPELDGVGRAGFCLLCVLETRKLRLCNLPKASQLVKRQSRDSDPFLLFHVALGKQDTPTRKVNNNRSCIIQDNNAVDVS